MPRNDGKNYTVARNRDLCGNYIRNAQGHNERQNETYSNEDIVPERTPFNVHFKQPTAGYSEMFDQMEQAGTISTRGLKADATHFCRCCCRGLVLMVRRIMGKCDFIFL